MGCNTNGSTPSQFALVSYIPDPLGLFLDNLRIEMAPGCKPHAHVTILPPRPVLGKASAAAGELERRLGNFTAFELELGRMELFPVSEVIFLSIVRGAEILREMHAALNSGGVLFEEPFPYHPHITLAQNLPPEQVQPLHNLAARRWAEYAGNRVFRVENLAFVRNDRDSIWIDLANISLTEPELVA
ncbi:MAG: 2'-5' RNA ligase family protein [Acidobacteriota bacterium]|nr:2'-5' RNA ligase family protein [Acidobacteriota bacterium]